MVKDQQVRMLKMLIQKEKIKAIAALKAGMDEKTARKYLINGKLPSKCKKEHNWRTRKDPFDDIWEEIKNEFVKNPFVSAKTLFEKLKNKYPNSYSDSQLRTLQRRVNDWRSTNNLNEEYGSWMLALLQGKISCDDLTKAFNPILRAEDINALLDCILNKPIKLRNRAIVILSYLKNIPASIIAKYLHINSKTVLHYIEKFNAGGTNRLLNNKRGKIKKSDDTQYKEAIFSILHAPPASFGINRTRWEMKFIHKVMKERDMPIAAGNIRKIIKDAGYKFRKAKKVLTSTDPCYREKLENITKTLSNLGFKEKFFSIDEFGPFAVKMRGGKALVAKGEERTIPQWQKSKGSLIVTAALELSTNQISHFYSKKKNTNEMIKLLDVLLNKYGDEDCIYFSWDAASWHASKKLYEKVEVINSHEFRDIHKTPIVRLAPLPSCAQFLNVIESVFSGMARAIIHNSDYQSVEECIIAIDRYFAERNQEFIKNPKRAGKKIWGEEIVMPIFKECNNCKDPKWR